jgi:ABC-2 type transport system ATP-binding protein
MDSGRLFTRSLTKEYGGSKGKRALDAVDLEVTSHGIFSLIGMNGAGKTTLVRILATQLEPTSGEASIDGMDVMKDARKLRDRIACVPQEARTPPFMTAKQTVLSYLLWRGVSYGDAKARATEALAKVGVADQADVLNRKLSGGTKRKVLVAAVLSSDADVIFLDEPTTGLDPVSRRDLWGLLSGLAKDRFLILTTHYLEEAERLADRIGILHNGGLIGIGTQDQLRGTVKYQYSLMVPSTQAVPRVRDGEVTVGSGGQTQILTSESEAHEISRTLFDQGAKFTMSKVSLDDVFFHLVHGAAEEEKE